jgi:predicted nucleic acid-binding protein
MPRASCSRCRHPCQRRGRRPRLIAMAAYLLDTNHISPLVTPAHPLRKRVLNSLQASNTFSIAVPALTELLFGISILPRARQNLDDR